MTVSKPGLLLSLSVKIHGEEGGRDDLLGLFLGFLLHLMSGHTCSLPVTGWKGALRPRHPPPHLISLPDRFSRYI